jgi:hypothetical protein
MPTLINTDNLIEDFPFVIHEDIPPKRLEKSIISASARLKSWIGETVYTSALADEETEERRIILENAEGHLALHFLILGLNTNIRNFGLVKSEQVEGNTTNNYFTPTDTANFCMQYLELAREIAEPYLLSDGTPTATFEVADVE